MEASSSLDSLDVTELTASNAALVGAKRVLSLWDLRASTRPAASRAVLMEVYPKSLVVIGPLSGRVRTLSMMWTMPPVNLIS